MSQTEIKAALAQQEDHIKRTASCMGRVGLPHAWRLFKAPDVITDSEFKRCVRCHVSENPLPFEYYVQQQ